MHMGEGTADSERQQGGKRMADVRVGSLWVAAWLGIGGSGAGLGSEGRGTVVAADATGQGCTQELQVPRGARMRHTLAALPLAVAASRKLRSGSSLTRTVVQHRGGVLSVGGRAGASRAAMSRTG